MGSKIVVKSKNNTFLHKWFMTNEVIYEYAEIENWLIENGCKYKFDFFGERSSLSTRLNSIEFEKDEDCNLFRLIFGHKYRIEEKC